MRLPRFPIASVERDVGLSKDVLRVWERRYGFPAPERGANGERLYSAADVQRLRVVKRLMDLGHRPGRLLATPVAELEALLARQPQGATTGPEVRDGLFDLVTLIGLHDADGYVRAMQQRLARVGLRQFVLDTVAPLTELIGVSWENRKLQIFEEHLFTELTSRVLRQAIAAVPGGREPRVLLTSLPNEQHAMGLLMVEALLSLEAAQCISLGTQMPLLEIADAALAHRADIVALSFSTLFPARQIPGLLLGLRTALPDSTQLWVGGGGVRRLARCDGVLILATLEEGTRAVAGWRAARAKEAERADRSAAE